MTLAELMEAGRELTPAQRVQLANELLASVDGADEDQTTVDAAWTAVVSSRVDDVLTGKINTIPFNETHARLSAKIAAARQ